MLTKEQIDDTVKDMLPNIMAAFKEEIKETALSQARETVRDQIRVAVEDWVKENLIPEIIKHLAEEKDGIISTIPKMIDEITHSLSKSLCGDLNKNLSSSWTRKKIFEALFIH